MLLFDALELDFVAVFVRGSAIEVAFVVSGESFDCALELILDFKAASVDLGFRGRF